MKKFLSLLLAMTLVVSCFAVVPVMAAGETITLELRDEVSDKGVVLYESEYSKYTLPGTTLNAKTVASLSPGQEVVYFLNGVEVGRANAAGYFDFTSVAGVNNLQAKIMSGNTVVAESNVIEKDFTSLVSGTKIRESALSSASDCGTDVILNNDFLSSKWVSFVKDPADANGSNVLCIKDPGLTPVPSYVELPVADFGTGNTDLSQGVVRVDVKYYAVNHQDAVSNLYVTSNCGCSSKQTAYPDSGYGTGVAPVKNATRNYYRFPAGKWIDLTLIVNSIEGTYDYYADGVQLLTNVLLCKGSHAQNLRTPKKIYLPQVMWQTKKGGEYCLKDFKYYKYSPATVFASAPANVVAGNQFVVTASSPFDTEYVYVVNGVESAPTNSTTYHATAKSGNNTVYVKAVSGQNVIAVSDPVTVTGGIVSLTTTRDFAHASNAVDTVINPNDDKNADGKDTRTNHERNYYEVGESYSLTWDTVDIDGRTGVSKYNIKNQKYNVSLYPQIASRSYFQGKTGDYVSISYDIKPVSIPVNLNIQIDNYRNGGEKTLEGIPSVFEFKADGTLHAGISGFGRVQTTYALNQWYTVEVLLSRREQVAYFLVNDVVYSSVPLNKFNTGSPLVLDDILSANNYAMFTIVSMSVKSNSEGLFYANNYRISLGYIPTITASLLTADVTIPAGSKVPVSVNVTGIDDAKIKYYINGTPVNGVTTDMNAHVTAVAGKNTVYAELVDDDGNVIATSNSVTFNAYCDTFVTAQNREGSSTYFATHTKHNINDKDNYKDFGVIGFENDTTTFSSDSEHGSTLKISAGEKGNDGNGINILTTYARRWPKDVMANAHRLYVQSIDVYPESITNGYLSVRPYNPYKGFTPALDDKGNYKTTQTNETAIKECFKFGADNKIYIATHKSNGTHITIPYTQKQWYTVSVIYDPMAEMYMLAVDGVIYSAFNTGNSSTAPKVFSEDLNENMMYLDITLGGSLNKNANVVYLDNHKYEYSIISEHSTIQYFSGANAVTNRKQISNASDLVVKFNVNKVNNNNIRCIATVLENNGELLCLATNDVTFTEDDILENVTLTLTNLPAGIADGGYTVNVMLWDSTNQIPIVEKIVLPN